MTNNPQGPLRYLFVPPKYLRIAVIFICLLIALAYLSQQNFSFPANDFNLYWSSSRLLLEGRNPYDPAGLLEYQRRGGAIIDVPVLMYYPPWALLFILPVGLVERQTSQMIWLLVNTAIILISSDQIWQHYAGAPKYRWIAWLSAFIFGPTFAALGYTGQITPLLLLGFIRFQIFSIDTKKEWLAGGFLLLAAIKPQVTYLFFIILLLWIFHQKRWKFLFGLVGAIVISTSVVMIFDPQVVLHFITNLTGNAPVTWATPTIGTYIRIYFQLPIFWIQFIPPLLATIAGCLIWYKKRDHWNWHSALPWVLLFSLITSPYTWTYDYPPLLIPIIAGISLLVRKPKHWSIVFAGFLYILMNAVYWWLHLDLTDFYFIWFIPALIIWYILVNKITGEKDSITNMEGITDQIQS
jgi:hypothetical protein